MIFVLTDTIFSLKYLCKKEHLKRNKSETIFLNERNRKQLKSLRTFKKCDSKLSFTNPYHITDERSDEKKHRRKNEENAEESSDRKPDHDRLPMPVAAFQEKPVETVREPLDLKQANLEPESLKKIEFVVTLEHENQRVNEQQHRKKV